MQYLKGPLSNVLDFAGDHKGLVPRNLMGILGAAKNCFVVEISKTSKNPIQHKFEKKQYRAISFVGGIKPSKPTSFDIRASMLKSSLVFTEDNFMERNCKREHALRNLLPQNHWL